MDNNSLFLRKYFVSFLKAWKMFFEISFPGAEYWNKYIDYSNAKYDAVVLYSIPVIGMMIGFVAFVVASIAYLFFGAIPAAVICSTVFIILWEIITHGKDTNYMVGAIAEKWAAFSKGRLGIEEPAFKEGNYVFMYIFIAVFALRVFCLVFLIYYHHFGWIVITTTLVMSTQGYLASLNVKKQNEIYIYAKVREQRIMWIITAIICVALSGFHFLPVAIAYLLTLLFGFKMKAYLQKNDMLNGESIGIAGKYVEIFVLIIGLIFITNIN